MECRPLRAFMFPSAKWENNPFQAGVKWDEFHKDLVHGCPKNAHREEKLVLQLLDF